MKTKHVFVADSGKVNILYKNVVADFYIFFILWLFFLASFPFLRSALFGNRGEV